MIQGKGLSDVEADHRFIFRNGSGQVWDTTNNAGAGGFEAWSDGSFANYGVAATSIGGKQFTAAEPSGATTFELWKWTGTLATSYAVYEGTTAANVVGKVAGFTEDAQVEIGDAVPVTESAPDITVTMGEVIGQ